MANLDDRKLKRIKSHPGFRGDATLSGIDDNRLVCWGPGESPRDGKTAAIDFGDEVMLTKHANRKIAAILDDLGIPVNGEYADRHRIASGNVGRFLSEAADHLWEALDDDRLSNRLAERISDADDEIMAMLDRPDETRTRLVLRELEHVQKEAGEAGARTGTLRALSSARDRLSKAIRAMGKTSRCASCGK